jgi:hypothetical protein
MLRRLTLIPFFSLVASASLWAQNALPMDGFSPTFTLSAPTPLLLSSTPVYQTMAVPGPTNCRQIPIQMSGTTGMGSLIGAAAGYHMGGGRDPFGSLLAIAAGSAIGNSLESPHTYTQWRTECSPSTTTQSYVSHYVVRHLVNGQVVESISPAAPPSYAPAPSYVIAPTPVYLSPSPISIHPNTFFFPHSHHRHWR